MDLRSLSVALALCLAAASARADVNARILRFPDISETQIAFSYAGDIWLAPKEGGVAERLSSAPGLETFPRFSPDGSLLAYSAQYDGNLDAYVVSTSGGLPTRITHHPAPDRVVDWSPDGRSVLVASSMESEKDRFDKLFFVPKEGGLPVVLPVPYGEFGAISADGKVLAYTPQAREFATWKRYRGGETSDIWLFGLQDHRSKNLTHAEANDVQPMWHGRKLYFASDRSPDKRVNIWVRDLDGDTLRQVTHFTDQDVHFPASGPSDIVFEQAGSLWRLSLADESLHELDIELLTDRATLKPRVANVEELIHDAGISPSGKRAVFEARGEIFTVPEKHGVIANLTQSSGAADRWPTWSPDGKRIAWFSDASGEYELTVRAADGTGEPRRVTSLGPGFRYRPLWSPDSKSVVFADQAMKIHLVDVASGKDRVLDRGTDLFEDNLENFHVAWSADSRWIAYARGIDNLNGAVFLYDTKAGKLTQATSGYYRDALPTFDPDGKYLYYSSTRTFDPSYGDGDQTWIYANTTNIVAVPLRADVASPLAPRNDAEGDDKDKEKDKDADGAKGKGKSKGKKKGKGADDDADQAARPRKSKDKKKPHEEKAEKTDEADTSAKKDEDEDSDDEDKKPEPVSIDLEGFEQRVVVLPIPAGNFDALDAIDGKIVYHVQRRTGESEDAKRPVKYWDLEEREEKTILEDADFFAVAAGGKKGLAVVDDDFAIVSIEADQKIEDKLPTDELEVSVDPVAEWHQLFSDAWRFERDFFYDPGMHGVDWNAMRTRYGALIDQCATRWDVNFVIGELIGELSSSHAYRGGGDVEEAPQRPVGLLGCDFQLKDGAFRVSRIVRGAAWDAEVRSPLDQPGAAVKEGEYVLAVNGRPLSASRDPWAAFEGFVGKTVDLTVGAKPSMTGARHVLVDTLTLEQDERLRHLEWMESHRRRVEERTKGRVGYVYVPDTGQEGQSELYRQFMGQIGKQGLVVDERFNSGGQMPDRFIEMLNRPILNYWAVRDGRDWWWPPVSIQGPKAMLINAWSGSGGDAFPLYFKEKGLGPLIGTRTWGGLIGISGSPDLIDGGVVTVPTFSIYSAQSAWIVENHGVDPDIEVVDDPALMWNGGDPQLDRAIDEVLSALEKNPPRVPPRPAYTKR